ncbi:PI31 proteasome regulator N-terminal-domain-containing protein [Auriculariales sp. MPI-PUGE-AT-0066]|nr:PI31 proteasome regulator N-terminal-domain-containing protein [Auriculariales sp. MPI-PUGE-AT-0066]
MSSFDRAVLDPSALLSLLPSLLPEDAKRLESPTSALAALVHAIMTALDFRLVAIDEDAASVHADTNLLPAQWRANPSSFSFRYKHIQSSLEFVLKVSRLGARTVTDKVASLDVQTSDFTSASAFPYDLATGGPLVHSFISSARVSDLTASFKTQIVQKILQGCINLGIRKHPRGLRKAAYSVIPPSSSNPQRPQAPQAPAAIPQPFDPGHPFQGPRRGDPYNPLEIGRQDREPLGGAFGPPFGPQFQPPGGGMFVGPDDPIFGGQARPRGPWGGDGFLPPMGAPPGARFDPVGPMGGPHGPPRPPRQPRGDNDEFMPPGFNIFRSCHLIPTSK